MKGNVQIAEIEHGKTVKLTALVEGPLSTDFVQAGANLSKDHPQLTTFVKEIQSLIKQNKLSSQNISFALPPDPLFINILPVDTSLKGARLKEHLDWEMSQFFPEAGPKDFIVGSHILSSADGDSQQAFMVGLRRGMVEFVQRAASQMKLKMHIVDIDQFSTEKTVILNYPEILEHEIVLFGIRYGGIDASLIREGQMTDYRAYTLEASGDPTVPIQKYLTYLRDRDIPEPAGSSKPWL
jgi:Tfp pilus assembly PilM family ATPase